MKQTNKWFLFYYESESIRDTIFEKYPDNEFTFADGFDDCIIGVVERFGMEPIICYDKDKVINSLQNEGMSYEEAYEYFDYNIIGAFVGETTPAFMHLYKL